MPAPGRPRPPLRAVAAALALLLLAACAREQPPDGDGAEGAAGPRADGSVTISGDDRLAGRLTWRAPEVELGEDEGSVPDALERARLALEAGDLDAGPGSAIPLYRAVLEREPGREEAVDGLERALQALLAQGGEAVARAGA
ncbi:MAG: hypothetical protein GX856_09345, partial [Gammaproteobacteria bacterium]|nr:hypothetical protein [Gammaproteobacteria bacterium]